MSITCHTYPEKRYNPGVTKKQSNRLTKKKGKMFHWSAPNLIFACPNFSLLGLKVSFVASTLKAVIDLRDCPTLLRYEATRATTPPLRVPPTLPRTLPPRSPLNSSGRPVFRPGGFTCCQNLTFFIRKKTSFFFCSP